MLNNSFLFIPCPVVFQTNSIVSSSQFHRIFDSFEGICGRRMSRVHPTGRCLGYCRTRGGLAIHSRICCFRIMRLLNAYWSDPELSDAGS